MTKETLKQIILTADEGMYLTDGETYGKKVVLPERADTSVWNEITEDEAETLQEERRAAAESGVD